MFIIESKTLSDTVWFRVGGLGPFKRFSEACAAKYELVWNENSGQPDPLKRVQFRITEISEA